MKYSGATGITLNVPSGNPEKLKLPFSSVAASFSGFEDNSCFEDYNSKLSLGAGFPSIRMTPPIDAVAFLGSDRFFSLDCAETPITRYISIAIEVMKRMLSPHNGFIYRECKHHSCYRFKKRCNCFILVSSYPYINPIACSHLGFLCAVMDIYN